MDPLAESGGGGPPASWLLLLDIGMPIMNGFEVLERLRAHPLRGRLRPVIVSGFYHPTDIERARVLGASDYVIKPDEDGDDRAVGPSRVLASGVSEAMTPQELYSVDTYLARGGRLAGERRRIG